MKLFVLTTVLCASITTTIIAQPTGSVHPAAKKIQADILYPFGFGSALIKKGTAIALINEQGSFVLPYSTEIKYSDPLDIPTYYSYGVYPVVGPAYPRGAFLGPNGKPIYVTTPPATGIGTGIWHPNGWKYFPGKLMIPDGNRRRYDEIFINANGTKVILPMLSFGHWNEDVVAYTDHGSKKHGFKSSKGQVIIPPGFDDASIFSDGLAAVAKKNELGEIKWGFIDITGKVAIPFKFTKKPGDFSNGLAAVFPLSTNEYKFAFINKSGDIKFKIPLNSQLEPPFTFGTSKMSRFEGGYFFSSEFSARQGSAMDVEGNPVLFTDFLKIYPLESEATLHTDIVINNDMFYTVGKTMKDYRVSRMKGIVNLKTEQITRAIFSELSMFDPVTNLAYAKLLLSEEGMGKYREGYINRNGIFVIVKADKDEF